MGSGAAIHQQHHIACDRSHQRGHQRCFRTEDAARLIEEMARRFPDNQSVAILAIESLILDRDDGQAALAALARFPAPKDNRAARAPGCSRQMPTWPPGSATRPMRRWKSYWKTFQTISGSKIDWPNSGSSPAVL